MACQKTLFTVATNYAKIKDDWCTYIMTILSRYNDYLKAA